VNENLKTDKGKGESRAKPTHRQQQANGRQLMGNEKGKKFNNCRHL